MYIGFVSADLAQSIKGFVSSENNLHRVCEKAWVCEFGGRGSKALKMSLLVASWGHSAAEARKRSK